MFRRLVDMTGEQKSIYRVWKPILIVLAYALFTGFILVELGPAGIAAVVLAVLGPGLIALPPWLVWWLLGRLRMSVQLRVRLIAGAIGIFLLVSGLIGLTAKSHLEGVDCYLVGSREDPDTECASFRKVRGPDAQAY